jgi:drug/metabolite transporter (DMT)-like permease
MIPSLIWGSTWYIIKFQIGKTDPMLSVGFRFFIAGALILLFCIFKGKELRFPLKSHLFIALQGLCLFGFNYWFVYMAEEHLTSALVAVVFSTLVFMNILFNRLILKGPIDSKVVMGALLGFTGVVFLFKNELRFNFSENSVIAIIFCFASVCLASLGNILSALNQKNKIPLIQTNGLGMLYGSLAMIIFAFLRGKNFILDTNPSYLWSLGYLAIFGSVVAFSVYLKMLGEIGPDKAGYVILVVPLVALIISTFFENYQWNIYSIVGAALLFVGNAITLRKSRKLKEASA